MGHWLHTTPVTDPAIWDYNGYFGGNRTVRLKPGQLDEDARDVFMRGHCHSMALALTELLDDAELMGVWIAGELQHVLVRLRDGALLDADGVSYDEDEKASFGLLSGDMMEIDIEDIDHVEEIDFYRPRRVKDAIAFAQTLVEREKIDTRELVAA